MCVPKQIGIGGCTCISRHRFSQIYHVHGHPSIFRHTYFGAASRRACGRAVAAGARAGARAWGCISLRVPSPLRTHRWAYHAHAGACLGHARSLPVASARSTPRPPIVARRARAARARGARQVHLLHEGEGAPRVARPVHALGGTVRPAPRRRPPPFASAAVPALRCCAWRCRAWRWGRAARRWMRRRRRCRSSAVGRAPRTHGWRARPTGARSGRAGAAQRGRTVGAQVGGRHRRVQHRARGAAGGGRLAEP